MTVAAADRRHPPIAGPTWTVLSLSLFVAAALGFFVLSGNLPGLADGLAPDSWPLAAWLGASGLYAAVVTTACLIRARDSGATLGR